MKILRTLVIITFLVCMSNPLSAMGQGEWEVGTEFSWFEYEEPNFMEEEGFLYGFFGTYTHRISENHPVESFSDIFGTGNTINMFELDARIGFGEVDYTSNGTGSLDGIDDFVFEIRGLAGYDFPVMTEARITPFIGLAYRYLNDDSGGRLTTTGAAGYERESNYFYLPIGVEFFNPLQNDWEFSAIIEYDVFLYGKQKSHLGDAISGLNTIENDQEDGFGVRGSVKFKKSTEKFDFFIEPYVRYWKIDDSEVSPVTFSGVLVGFGLEPENESIESGARIGINF